MQYSYSLEALLTVFERQIASVSDDIYPQSSNLETPLHYLMGCFGRASEKKNRLGAEEERMGEVPVQDNR